MEFVYTLHIVSHFYCKNRTKKGSKNKSDPKSFYSFDILQSQTYSSCYYFRSIVFHPKAFPFVASQASHDEHQGRRVHIKGHRTRGLVETPLFFKPQHFTASFLSVFSRYIFFVFIHRMLYTVYRSSEVLLTCVLAFNKHSTKSTFVSFV